MWVSDERRGGGGAGQGSMRGSDKEEEKEGQTGVTREEAKRGEARGEGGQMTAADTHSCSAFSWKVATETGVGGKWRRMDKKKKKEEEDNNIFPFAVYVQNIAE